MLDPGEASVIQSAIDLSITTVAIDEKQGRRLARLHQLQVTGSIGILVKAVRAGFIPDLRACFDRMHLHGIWISQDLQLEALRSLQ